MKLEKNFRFDFLVGTNADMEQDELFDLIEETLQAHGITIEEGSVWETHVI